MPNSVRHRARSPTWPGGKRFAFTIVDDTDCATIGNVGPVYDFLYDHGFLTTKTVWPLAATTRHVTGGDSLQDAAYRRWVLELARRGFEIAYHGTTDDASTRPIIEEGFRYFVEVIGHDPRLHTNHTGQHECIYWGESRFDGLARAVYRALQASRRVDTRYYGHLQGSPYFWGDLCRMRISYVRNFVFQDINTLRSDPLMPYHDPRRPDVKFWFSSSNGATGDAFCATVHEANQDRLVAEGGACIMYAHLAVGFNTGHGLLPRFVELMRRLSKLPGWFVPASTLLDFLRTHPDWEPEATAHQLQRLQWSWLGSRAIQRIRR
jgi:hypothetical protein